MSKKSLSQQKTCLKTFCFKTPAMTATGLPINHPCRFCDFAARLVIFLDLEGVGGGLVYRNVCRIWLICHQSLGFSHETSHRMVGWVNSRPGGGGASGENINIETHRGEAQENLIGTSHDFLTCNKAKTRSSWIRMRFSLVFATVFWGILTNKQIFLSPVLRENKMWNFIAKRRKLNENSSPMKFHQKFERENHKFSDEISRYNLITTISENNPNTNQKPKAKTVLPTLHACLNYNFKLALKTKTSSNQ